MPFTTATFTFLRGLARNNRKPRGGSRGGGWWRGILFPDRAGQLFPGRRDVDAAEAGAAQSARRDRGRSAALRADRDGRPGDRGVRRAGRGGDAEAGAARLRPGPPGGALAAVPVVHAGPRAAGRSGPGRATAGAARRGLPADRTAGAVDQRSTGTQTSRAAVVAAGAGPASTNCFVTGSTRRLSPSMLREPSSTRSPGMPNTISSPTRFPAKWSHTVPVHRSRIVPFA